MKNVLISGAGGYIGRHIHKVLSQGGYNVIASTRTAGGQIKMDFSKPCEIAEMKICNIDVMIHAVSPNESLFKTDPYAALSEQIAGIRSAMEFCINNDIPNFIYISSFHVFGVATGVLDENRPVAPCNDYGLSHYIAEQTIDMYNRMRKINAWIIRPSNIFGVPVDCDKFKRWNLIPFAFCKEAIEKNTITLLSSGSQLRNFVGVSDVCKIVKWVIEERPDRRIIHAYGNETMSVYDYALYVKRVAMERFKLPVEISRTHSYNQVAEFEFTSTLECNEISPSEKLSEFISEMLTILLASKGKGGDYY